MLAHSFGGFSPLSFDFVACAYDGRHIMGGTHRGGSCWLVGGQEAGRKRWSHTISLDSNDIKSPIRLTIKVFASFAFTKLWTKPLILGSLGENLFQPEQMAWPKSSAFSITWNFLTGSQTRDLHKASVLFVRVAVTSGQNHWFLKL